MFKWVKNAYAIDVAFHIDADGLTAAAQFIKWLKSQGKKYNLVTGSAQKMGKQSFYKKLKNELVVFIDLPADDYADELYKLNNRANIVIIDHHKLINDLNSKSIVQFNPKLMGIKDYCPASKMVYDLIGGIDWMACIGIIGDYGGKYWRKFIDNCLKKHGLKPCKEENCFDTEFSYYNELINAAGMVKGDEGSLEALEALVDSSDYNDFRSRCSKLVGWYDEVNDYISDLEDEFDKRKEEHKDLGLVFYEINKPKYRVGSALSTRISTKHPSKTIVLLINKGLVVNVNLRRQDGLVDVALLAKSAVLGLDKASGGGHKKAAGATLKSSDLIDFKEAIKKAASNSG